MPWLGAVMGYFTWTLVVSGDPSRSFAATVAYVGRGVIARPREGRSRNPVARVTCYLTDMLDRHGLRDGKQVKTSRALSGLTVEIWAFDPEFEKGPFWYD